MGRMLLRSKSGSVDINPAARPVTSVLAAAARGRVLIELPKRRRVQTEQ
jgi:hypothetical protein